MKELEFISSHLNEYQQCIANPPKVKQYKRSMYIYKPEEVANEIYIVKKGVVKIIFPDLRNNNPTNQITKSLLSVGHFFGEMILVGERVRKDYAFTIEETELEIYTRDVFQLLLQKKPCLQNLVLQHLGKKLMTIEKRFAAIILQDAQSRIINFLLELARDKGVKVGFDIMINQFLTQQEIANYTATARQTVSTVLNRLRDKNLIYYTRKKLLIRDLSLLEQELLLDTAVSNS